MKVKVTNFQNLDNIDSQKKTKSLILLKNKCSYSNTNYLKLTPGNKEGLTCGGTADILKNERKKTTFNIDELYEILCGGKELIKRRKFIESAITNSYNDNYHELYDKTRQELMEISIKDFIEIHKKFKNFKPNRYDISVMTELSLTSGPLNNSHGIFLQTIAGQGSEEQVNFWMPKILNFEITGSYAQTELGHGSNIRGLRTTAEFDPKTDEFVLNTPTLSSIKWWPSALGKASTHCVLYAQLIVYGKEYGLSVFIAQIRDEKFLPLPGVRMGDLGVKIGDNVNDTGFLILKDIRIPRENMLCRFRSVSRNGEVQEVNDADPKVHYTTMIQMRANLSNAMAVRLAQAATIAIRYSCIRTQGFIDTKPGVSYLTKEIQLIDHQIQRYRLLKQLSVAYALKFTSQWIVEQQSSIEGKELGIIKSTALLRELAAATAGLKSLFSIICPNGSEDLRKTCGGNGYLLHSGIAFITSYSLAIPTAEGDVIVLGLFMARHLLSTINSLLSGKNVKGQLKYLNNIFGTKSLNLEKEKPKRLEKKEELSNLDYLLQIFRFKAIDKIVSVTMNFNSQIRKQQKKFEVAWNDCSLEWLEASHAHCYYLIIENFVSKINQINNPDLSKVLTQLCILFSCTTFLDNNWIDTFEQKELNLIQEEVVKLLEDLRPNAVGLVDAFGFSDKILKSSIGGYNGNVYESLFEAAQKSILNRKDPFIGYEYLKPHLNSTLLALGNKSIRTAKF